MVVTTVNPNIFGGNLCLNSTPATKFYFDTNLPAIREFTASLQMNGVGGQQNRHLLKSLLGKNKFSKYVWGHTISHQTIISSPFIQVAATTKLQLLKGNMEKQLHLPATLLQQEAMNQILPVLEPTRIVTIARVIDSSKLVLLSTPISFVCFEFLGCYNLNPLYIWFTTLFFLFNTKKGLWGFGS